MKTALSRICFFVVCCAMTTIASSAVHPSEKTVIRFSYGPIAMNTPLFVACENGYFEKRGITMEMNNFQATQKMGIQLMEAGEGEGAAVSFINLTLSRQQGYHVKLVASWGYGGPGDEQTALVVLKDSPIKTIKELSGKNVGGFLRGTEFAMQQQELFEKNGVVNANHIELPITQTMGALQGKTIVAAQLIEPQLTLMRNEIRILALYDEADGRGYGFPDRLIKEKPEVIRAWIEALQEGVRFVIEHEDCARTILSKWSGVPITAAKQVRLPMWDVKCRIITDGIDRSLVWMEKQKLLKKKMDIGELCDYSFTGKITSQELATEWKRIREQSSKK